MENNLLRVEDVPNVLAELEDAFFDIPFENSAFQTRAFVVAAQQTPARAYRAVGLQMMSKIQAIKEFIFKRERDAIDIEEKDSIIADPATSEFERRRLRLDIAQINERRRWGDKLLNDAMRELDVLHSIYQKFPRFTREQFEAEEATHFEAKLKRQLTANGPMESLLNMNADLPGLNQILLPKE